MNKSGRQAGSTKEQQGFDPGSEDRTQGAYSVHSIAAARQTAAAACGRCHQCAMMRPMERLGIIDGGYTMAVPGPAGWRCPAPTSTTRSPPRTARAPLPAASAAIEDATALGARRACSCCHGCHSAAAQCPTGSDMCRPCKARWVNKGIEFCGLLGQVMSADMACAGVHLNLRQGGCGPQRRRRRLAQQLHREVAHPLEPVLHRGPLAGLPGAPQVELAHRQPLNRPRCSGITRVE